MIKIIVFENNLKKKTKLKESQNENVIVLIFHQFFSV
jgi:hypothetical protein